MKSQVWKLTQLGRKRASSIYGEETHNSIISYLRENKTASEEELASVTGQSVTGIKSFLRRNSVGPGRPGLVESLGGY